MCLFPPRQRDVLLELACARTYRALWSNQIEQELSETITRLRENKHLDGSETQSYITRLLKSMNQALPDARIELNHRILPPATLNLPDPNDYHVINAAIVGGAHLIVTNNIKDFPQFCLPASLEVKIPDEFLCDILGLDPELTLQCVQTVSNRTGNKGPHVDIAEMLDLLAVFTPEFANNLANYYHATR